MTGPNPLHPATREWLRSLYAHKAARLHESGVPLDEAKEEARTLALSFRDALRPGPDEEPPVLIDMGPCDWPSSTAKKSTPAPLAALPETRPNSLDLARQIRRQMKLGGEAA